MDAPVGYARVSSTGQSLDIQLARLKQHGCGEIFEEKLTGTRSDRPRLKACLEYIRKGETLVVTRIDRLARSTLHLCQIVEMLRQKEASLVVLDQHIETVTPEGKLHFHMLAAIAEFETGLRYERQMEGIRAAQAKGTHFGRARQLGPQDVQELRRLRTLGIPVTDLRQRYRLSRASIYRYLAETAPAEQEHIA